MSIVPILLSIGGFDIEIEGDPHFAPGTLSAVQRCLQVKTDVHVGKVSDAHLMLPIPHVHDFEGADDRKIFPAGTVLYYPRRQILELLFEPTEAFAANCIGSIAAGSYDMQRFSAIARLSESQPVWAIRKDILKSDDQANIFDTHGILAELWAGMPADFSRLSAMTGELAPIASAVYAESELRKLHEFLWALRETGDLNLMRMGGSAMLRSTASQMIGFFGMDDTAALITRIKEALLSTDKIVDCFDHVLLCVGRLSFWAAFVMPWKTMNSAESALKTRIARLSHD